MSLGPYEKQLTEDPRLDSPPIRGLNLSTVRESLRGIIPVYDHPGLLLISVKVITKIKASFPGVAQFI